MHTFLSYSFFHNEFKGKWDSNQNSYNTKLLAVEVLSLFAATESTKETMSKSQLVPHLKHLMHHETGVWVGKCAHILLMRYTVEFISDFEIYLLICQMVTILIITCGDVAG